MTDTVWQPPRLDHPVTIAVLTPRQAQVLNGMCRGLSNKDIGRELYLSEETIKTHARTLFRKLQARDRAHAAYLAGTGHITVVIDNKIQDWSTQ